MLFGTALLTTIDILIEESLFKSANSDIRNVALILGHFLSFAQDMKEMCRANEDGWRKIVLARADEHGIEPYLTRTDHVISDIRKSSDVTNSDSEETPRPAKRAQKGNAS